MSELSIFNITTLILDLGTIFLILGLIMVTGVLRQRGREDDKMFFYLLIIEIVVAISDIVGYLADGKNFYGANFVQMAAMQVFYMAFTLESVTWSHYSDIRFKGSEKDFFRKRQLAFYAPGIILLIMLFVNAFTGWIFSVDMDNVYHRGPLFIPMYIVEIFYITFGFVNVLRYRDAGADRILIPIWIYFLPIVIGIVVTFVIGGVSLAPIGMAVSIMFTHLGSMNETSDNDYED